MLGWKSVETFFQSPKLTFLFFGHFVVVKCAADLVQTYFLKKNPDVWRNLWFIYDVLPCDIRRSLKVITAIVTHAQFFLKKWPEFVATTQVLECGGRTPSQIPSMTFYDFHHYISDSAAPVDISDYVNEITRYNMIWYDSIGLCDFSSTFIQEKGWAATTTESRACRRSLSWCHSDVVGVQGKLISEFVRLNLGKVEKAGILGGIVSIDCWNMLKWYWKCPSIWLLWIYSLFQWDKSETRKKNISKLVWASVRQPLAISHRTIAEVWKVYKGLAKQEPRMQGRSLTSSESRAVPF